MNKFTVIFDFSGTLVRMRPPFLFANRKMLAKLAQKAELVILTGGKRSEVTNIMKKVRIDMYFTFIVTKDDTSYRKPQPQLIEKIQKMQKSDKILYIGDTIKDYRLARSAKVDFFYVGNRKLGIFQNPDVNQIIKYIYNCYVSR